MPSPDPPRRRPPRFAAALALFAGLVALATAQDGRPQKPADAGAFRLPDGTVVFFTKNPDEPNPKIDGVLLAPKEYQALLDQAEQLKKAKEAARPVPPSECHVRGRVEAKRDRPFAALRLTYAFRTTAPRAVVALGCQRAYLAAVAGGDGKLPLLAASDDGLTVLAERPGEHALTLDVEVPVGPRGGKGEVGFEFGLPRAAITTFALDPPGPQVKKLTVATRAADLPPPAAKGGETKRVTEDAARYAPGPGAHGPPLGPVEALEVTWEAPAAATPAAAETPTAVEADVAVRLDDTQVETTAKLRLRGPAREWQFALPPGPTVNLTVERVGGPAAAADGGPAVTRPAGPGQGWTFRTPDAGEWLATVTARQSRPDAKDPKHPGPYPVGPFVARDVPRQAGTVRVFAPVGVRVTGTAPREVRRQDAPAGGGEDTPVLVYRYAAPPARDGTPVPLVELDARPARGAVIVQPVHKLRLTEAGWRLRTEVKVTPVRREVEDLVIELPAGWQTPDVLPPELVEGVQDEPGRRFTARLAEPHATAFDLAVEAVWPVPLAAREAAIALPRFPGAVERGSQVAVSVPDGFEVRGAAREGDGPGPADFRAELKPPAPPAGAAAVTAVAGKFDAAVARVELAWQPYRPELAADVRADVTLHDRQAEVSQAIQLSAADGLPRAVRLKGPPAPHGFRSRPTLEQVGPGDWVLHPAPGEKQATVTLSYAVPVPAGSAAGVPVPLVWPDATRAETTARVWCNGRRVARVAGPWRERPPEPAADRDALPALTLAGTGAGLPLALDVTDAVDGDAPVVIDRAAVEAWAGADGTAKVRGRFVLRRWPAAVEVEVPAGAAVKLLVDGKEVPRPEVADAGEVRVVRAALPEPRPTRPFVSLEVRYEPPPARGRWAVAVAPPVVRGAVVRTPVRWQITAPASAVPLVPDDGFAADARWQWRGWGFAPAAGMTPADLDAWLAAGADPEAADEAAGWVLPGGEVATGRQPVPGPLRVVRVPRTGWVIGWSVLVFLGGLVASRLRPAVLGVAVAAVGAAAAVGAVVFPQPAGQAAAAAQPGLALLAVTLAAQAARRWYHRWRVTHLPTFARGSVADRVVGPASGSAVPPARSSRNGAPADAATSGSSIPPLAPANPG